MTSWRPLQRHEIVTKLERAVAGLHPVHRLTFSQISVPPYNVPVAATPGEAVWVVAHHDGMFLYYSDIEDGWAFAHPDASGGISDRDCNQFELSLVMSQHFGKPKA